jgi:hypothetical protein
MNEDMLQENVVYESGSYLHSFRQDAAAVTSQIRSGRQIISLPGLRLMIIKIDNLFFSQQCIYIFEIVKQAIFSKSRGSNPSYTYVLYRSNEIILEKLVLYTNSNESRNCVQVSPGLYLAGLIYSK